MTPPFRYRLSDREKDALLSEQAALIERQAARIAELEGLLCRPRKTSRNSGLPPSCDQKPGRSGSHKGKAKPRPSRPGSARSLVVKIIQKSPAGIRLECRQPPRGSGRQGSICLILSTSGLTQRLEPPAVGVDDGVGIGAPDEGFGAVVVFGDEAVDGGLELCDRGEDAITYRIFRTFGTDGFF